MKSVVLATVAVLAVSGCSSFGQDQVNKLNSLIAQGRCMEAYSVAESTSDDVRYSNTGVVAHNCERNPSKARSYYEYGARLGEQNAINNLLRNNWPVPAPDLQRQRQASSANDAALGMQLLQAAQPRRPQMTSCSSYKLGNTIQTDCQ